MQEGLKDPGRRIVGAKQVIKAIEKGLVSFVYIARDADPFVTRPVIVACEAHGVRFSEVESMKVLGQAAGIDVGASVAGVKQ